MSTQLIGFIRGLLYVVAFAVLSFLADASHLTGVLTPAVTLVVTTLATAFLGMLDGHIEQKTGRAVFGAAAKK